MNQIELEKAILKEKILYSRSQQGGPRGPQKSEQEKIQIVKAYLSGGRTLKQIAAGYGVGMKSIYRWIAIFADTDTEERASKASAAPAADAMTIANQPSHKIYMSKKSKQQGDQDPAALKAEIVRLQKEVELANYKVHVGDVLIEEEEKTFNIAIKKNLVPSCETAWSGD